MQEWKIPLHAMKREVHKPEAGLDNSDADSNTRTSVLVVSCFNNEGSRGKYARNCMPQSS